jgi:hypothetical protein
MMLVIIIRCGLAFLATHTKQLYAGSKEFGWEGERLSRFRSP